MRRLLLVLLGIAAGLMVAIPILLALSALGVLGSEGDPPLTGWIPFVATLGGCVLAGAPSQAASSPGGAPDRATGRTRAHRGRARHR
jgi:hypothetical protein